MTRVRRTLLLAAAIAALAAPSAGAYGHLGQAVGIAGAPAALAHRGAADRDHGGQRADQHPGREPTPRSTRGTPSPPRRTRGARRVDCASRWTSTADNYGTAWGDLNGDGQQEVVFDEDGTAITALGLAPASVNGYGPSHGAIHNGEAEIDDMFLIINGSRTNFDRQSTEVHELGHTLGPRALDGRLRRRQGRRAVGGAREPGADDASVLDRRQRPPHARGRRPRGAVGAVPRPARSRRRRARSPAR